MLSDQKGYFFTMNRELVYKKYSFNIVAHRILFLAFAKIKGKVNDSININLDEYISTYDSKKELKISDLIIEIKKLNEIEYISGDGWRWNWLAGYKPVDSKNVLIKLNPYLEGDVSNFLAKPKAMGFAKIYFKHCYKLSSDFAMRMYQILVIESGMRKHKSNDGFNYVTISLDELKEATGLTGKYPVWSDFSKRVIATAKKQINQNTNITFDTIPYKTGRDVTGITLKFKAK